MTFRLYLHLYYRCGTLRPHLESTDIISILVVEPSDNSIPAWLLIIQSLSLLRFGV
nr:MAG TPA: hypothetical protein [Bacteriophage sp.]